MPFLTWFGSLTTSALVYLFSNDGLGPDGSPGSIKAWALLLSIFLSEHAFLVLRWGVRVAISKLDSPGRQKERRERFMVRKQYFEENLNAMKQAPKMAEAGGNIDRESLEEDARRGSLRTATAEERFWARQRGWRETTQVGKGLIERAVVVEEEEGEGKKEL